MIKQWLILMLLAVLASSAMPSAASAEVVDNSISDSITVGVTITDEPFVDCSGDDVTLTFPNIEGDLVATEEDSGTQVANLGDLMWFHFRGSANVESATLFSFGDNPRAQAITADIFSGTNSSVTYAVAPEPMNHIADFNNDGVLNQEDMPDYLLSAFQGFSTNPFEVSYDAGECSEDEPFGALSVHRSPLLKQQGPDPTDWVDIEMPPHSWDRTSDLDGKGTAWLEKVGDTEQNLLPNLNHIAYDLAYPFQEYLSFGTGDLLGLAAGVELLGQYDIGNYKVQFFFELEVDGYSNWLQNPQFCSYLSNEPEVQCAF